MNCKSLIHPFQYDTGISQNQRVMEDLLDGPAQLDGRTMADMLGYFVKFSRQINFYDEDGTTKDWQPFFQNSLPFITASILNFRQDLISSQINTYQKKFLRRPSKAGLDILVSYICNKVIKPFTSWDRQLHNSGLPIENVLDGLIKKTLRDQCLPFIRCVNTAVKRYHVNAVDLTGFFQPDPTPNAWNLTPDLLSATLTSADFKKLGGSKRARLIGLYNAIAGILTPFLKAINGATGAAGISLTQSFESLRDDLKQRHQPHLALIFAFLNLFRHLQDSLNGFTKQHLDFFYRQVLAFQPKTAVPDKANIVITIQKQLASYRLAKGITLKGPKDSNKADILFALDDEIVVNQAQATDIRTLFVNNQSVLDKSYIQGVYMAPVATKADGLTKDFPDGAPASWSTVGARYSKYTDPATKVVVPYPTARLAFVLASPVLLLNEGTRTITITLTCKASPIADLATIFAATKSTIAEKGGLDIVFSGAKDWVTPAAAPVIALSDLSDTTFTLTITSTLQLSEPAITFYNATVLKEDIGITQPAARITLDDSIKMYIPPPAATGDECCLRPPGKDRQEVSLYHLFRNVTISDTNITVQACGLKKFIVQNDDSIQDVNKPVYPFGTRPSVIGFDLVTTPQKANPVIPAPPPPGVIEAAPPAPVAAPAAAPAAAPKNLIGPNFYIGSQEIFCKKWTAVNINLNWKDKPSSFNDYYRAYWADINDNTKYGLDADGFEVNVAVLQQQRWLPEKDGAQFTVANAVTKTNNRKLFDTHPSPLTCPTTDYQQTITLTNNAFNGYTASFDIDPATPLTKYDVSTQQGFVRLNLQNQDFLAKDYAYVLARQMMAFSKLAGNTGKNNNSSGLKIENAVYYGPDGPIVFSTNAIKTSVDDIDSTIADIYNRLLNSILPNIDVRPGIPVNAAHADDIRYGLFTPGPGQDFKAEVEKIMADVATGKQAIDGDDEAQAIIPNEPWTPIIQGLSLDYSATAIATDITLVHLYPFAGTYKLEDLPQQPTLFASFMDEGTLFLGLDQLVPGSNVNILFQLAEATADTEEEEVPLEWSYLDNNVWHPLRIGFEIVDDATDSLSTSGIIEFSIPGNITTVNTVMPAGLSWIKAGIGSNSGIVAETLAVYTQAIEVTFTDADANDKQRLAVPLPEGLLTKLSVADANVKKIDQPYDSFGGRVPETDGYFYVRVSETLRHKGRAIQKCDYERIALDAFPQLYKAKCINHSFGLNAHKYANDYPMAPGYVLLAVIPDLNQLKAAASYEPRVPLSILEELETRMQQLTSPFVRFRAMNPRYEAVDFALQVKLLPDRDENYYKQKLQDDIRQFMAPWAVGEFTKLRFGQVINRSDVIRFLETRDYLDYVIDWKWRHEEDENHDKPADQAEIFPMTPRSILIAGTIDVTILQSDCAGWDTAPTTNPLNKVNIYKNGQ